MNEWYSRQYLGKSFDRFLKSEMSLKDFQRLQQELQQVLVQLRLSRDFTGNGLTNRIGGTHTKIREAKENSDQRIRRVKQ